MLTNQASMSLYLQAHPIIDEHNIEKRQKYVDYLYYYTAHINDRFAKALLLLYRKYITGLDYTPKPNPSIRGLFKYRYILFMDVWLISSFNSPEEGKRSLHEIENKSPILSTHKKKIRSLYSRLFEGDSVTSFPQIEQYLDYWDKNHWFFSKQTYRIAFTANMSAGKSTLINALVGKKVNKSQCMACTAKLHYIYNKPFEDGFTAEDDNVLNLDADYNTLMTDDEGNEGTDIIVSTYFRLFTDTEKPICFLDTPGVNSALNQSHKEITNNEISSGRFDQLVYVINSDGNIASNDEVCYMTQLAKTYQSSTVVFVVNKLDSFRTGQDSVSESIERIKDDVEKIGFNNAIICPTSAYTGYLAKRALFDGDLDEDELEDLSTMRRLFKREGYKLSSYYSEDALAFCEEIIETAQNEKQRRLLQLLCDCGIMPLEYVLINRKEQ